MIRHAQKVQIAFALIFPLSLGMFAFIATAALGGPTYLYRMRVNLTTAISINNPICENGTRTCPMILSNPEAAPTLPPGGGGGTFPPCSPSCSP